MHFQINSNFILAAMKKLVVQLFLLFLFGTGVAQDTNNNIPKPQSIVQQPGTFILHRKIAIVEGPAWVTGDAAARVYCTQLKDSIGLHLAIVNAMREGTFENAINLKKIKDASLGSDGYRIKIKKPAIIVEANNDTGLTNALQYLFQIIPRKFFEDKNPKAKIPLSCSEITCKF